MVEMWAMLFRLWQKNKYTVIGPWDSWYIPSPVVPFQSMKINPFLEKAVPNWCNTYWHTKLANFNSNNCIYTIILNKSADSVISAQISTIEAVCNNGAAISRGFPLYIVSVLFCPCRWRHHLWYAASWLPCLPVKSHIHFARILLHDVLYETPSSKGSWSCCKFTK